MNNKETILLLNGSPKPNGGTSGTMARYLKNRLAEKGCTAEIVCARSSIANQDHIGKLIDIADFADVMVILFPLYIDCLPYPVIKVLELVAEHERSSGSGNKQRLLAIANCGFPEASHNHTALAICRRFAKETGRQWIGGLGLGGGQMIDGRIDKVGRLAGNLKKSLDLAAEAIAQDKPLSAEAEELMAKPMVPGWLYYFIANKLYWKKRSKGGVWEKINDQPYKTEKNYGENY